MSALSLVPPAFKGVLRGRGSVDLEFVLDEAIEEGGGERMNPPEECSWVAIAM